MSAIQVDSFPVYCTRFISSIKQRYVIAMKGYGVWFWYDIESGNKHFSILFTEHVDTAGPFFEKTMVIIGL